MPKILWYLLISNNTGSLCNQTSNQIFCMVPKIGMLSQWNKV